MCQQEWRLARGRKIPRAGADWRLAAALAPALPGGTSASPGALVQGAGGVCGERASDVTDDAASLCPSF